MVKTTTRKTMSDMSKFIAFPLDYHSIFLDVRNDIFD
jgi:hypothetical protein